MNDIIVLRVIFFNNQIIGVRLMFKKSLINNYKFNYSFIVANMNNVQI